MKYLVLLGDGMADYPIKELGDLTPLQKADKPFMDNLAKYSEIGLAKTVPDHLNPPGSDIANMSVMGYNPDVYYTGRSPLEAVSMGIELADDDIAIRCNLVTLSDEEKYEDTTMVDYSSDEISTEESRELIKYLDENLSTDTIKFYPGISYRHCVVLKNQKNEDMKFTPPHDISGRKIAEYTPKGEIGLVLFEIMKKSRELLANHPINKKRIEKGLHPATSAWLWGQGRRPSFDSFESMYNLKGCVISAVDLVKGLGMCARMEAPEIPGTTGNIHTNFEAKADAAIEFYKKGGEFVYLHVEAPDECGHRHEVENKVKAIEYLDSRILSRIIAYFKESGDDYKILVMPDHPTPLSIMTHTHEPVPYMIYDSRVKKMIDESATYCEAYAKNTGIYRAKGYELIGHFIGN
ncbi:MAG: cofactor-independent phosphoglycerate mutase [Ruminococcaceae bacterium]|nr:cofactor-independent phosphoglycerate mutase [Oscillospiraceae bacterium]